jgi:hypothetical protein
MFADWFHTYNCGIDYKKFSSQSAKCRNNPCGNPAFFKPAKAAFARRAKPPFKALYIN